MIRKIAIVTIIAAVTIFAAFCLWKYMLAPSIATTNEPEQDQQNTGISENTHTDVSGISAYNNETSNVNNASQASNNAQVETHSNISANPGTNSTATTRTFNSPPDASIVRDDTTSMFLSLSSVQNGKSIANLVDASAIDSYQDTTNIVKMLYEGKTFVNQNGQYPIGMTDPELVSSSNGIYKYKSTVSFNTPSNHPLSYTYSIVYTEHGIVDIHRI